MEVLVLMAASDGELGGEERQFLTILARRLDVPLNLDDAKRRAAGYRQKEQANTGKSAVSWAANQFTDRALAARTGIRDRLSRAARRSSAKQGPADQANENYRQPDHQKDPPTGPEREEA